MSRTAEIKLTIDLDINNLLMTTFANDNVAVNTYVDQ
jgi:hypothetical protein